MIKLTLLYTYSGWIHFNRVKKGRKHTYQKHLITLSVSRISNQPIQLPINTCDSSIDQYLKLETNTRAFGHSSFPNDTRAITRLTGLTSKLCLWYLKHSCTNLLEGYRCDLASNSISDDYHISINVYRQTGDNEQR